MFSVNGVLSLRLSVPRGPLQTTATLTLTAMATAMPADEEQHSYSNKTHKACDQCRSRKVKCDGLPTCSRCFDKGLSCTYNYVFKKRLRKKAKEVSDKPKRRRGRPRKTSIVNSPLVSEKDRNVVHNNAITIGTHPLIEGNDSGVRAVPMLDSINGRSDMGRTFMGLSVASTPGSANGYATGQGQGPPPPTYLPANNTQYGTNTIRNYDPNFYMNTALSHPPALSPLPSGNLKQSSNVEQRLQKLESMISLLLDKFSSGNQYANANRMTAQASAAADVNACVNSLTLSNVNAASNSHIRVPSDMASNSNSATHRSFNMNQAPSGSELSKAKDSPQLYERQCCSLSRPEDYQKWLGLLMHTSIFFLSSVGMKILENKMEHPELLGPLKQIVQVSTPYERKIISIWTNPIQESQLKPLPSRSNIECLLQSLRGPFYLVKVLDLDYLKHLLRQYCDFRDGLIPEPYFSYSDYLLMNSSLLVACLVTEELSGKSIEGGTPMPEFDSLREVSDYLLDNSLFYYSRLSIISGGLTTITGSIFLGFYADSISLSRAAYLISSSAIRQAQELGLHIEETYRTLPQHERILRLNMWWTCYAIDRELCIRWGQTPVINDNDISAPPLPGFEAYWSPNENDRGQNVPSKRSIYYSEIQTLLEPLLENPVTAIDMEQYIIADYAFVSAKVYDNFLRAGALKNATKKEAKQRLVDTIAELDYWRKSIPKLIRPRTKDDDPESFYKYIEQLKNTNTVDSLYQMILATSMHVRYHHVKLMIYRAYSKHCYVEYGEQTDEDLLYEPVISARSILRMSCVVDSRYGSYANYFIYYPFNAFLSICGLYILLEKESPDLKSDLQLLINSIKLHFTPFVSNKKHREKGGMVELVLKGMLYATYVTCQSRFGNLPLEGLDVLDDPKAIAEGTKTAADIIFPLFNQIETRFSPERPLCKLPYFYNQNTSMFVPKGASNNSDVSPLHSDSPMPVDQANQLSDIPILVNNDTDRTPNVSFLLSPAHQPVQSNIQVNTEEGAANSYKGEVSEEKNPFLSNGGNAKNDKEREPDYFNVNDGKDTLFHNMLNIPNYFFDYLYEDNNNPSLPGFP